MLKVSVTSVEKISKTVDFDKAQIVVEVCDEKRPANILESDIFNLIDGREGKAASLHLSLPLIAHRWIRGKSEHGLLAID